MNWRDFFLLCLGVGFGFSLVSVLAGAHFGHLHLPHWHGSGGHGAGHGASRGAAVNPSTISAFLLWFGASGYLLARFADWRMMLVLAAATACGLAGAAVVFWFFARVLMANEKPLDPLDYDMTGVLGRLSGSMRPQGTGEMIFTQQGRRRGVAVRSETGQPLAGGTEVIVTRYEGGIAYVRTWDELQNQ